MLSKTNTKTKKNIQKYIYCCFSWHILVFQHYEFICPL